jgi:glycosyltransferase involved in cell wall biosynthesis
LKVLALVSDAHGGFGGISQYNRDALEAMVEFPNVEGIDVVPRLMPSDPGRLPDRITYDNHAAAGKMAFLKATARRSIATRDYGLIYCAHVKLVPAALMAAALARAPVVLAIYGIDVWEPLGALSSSQIKVGTSHVVSISEITRDRFLDWCPISPDRVHIVPNAIRLEAYGAGPRAPAMTARYGLSGRKVIMTMGRMVGQDRAKGFDEIIELLPDLRTEYPSIAYMAVGDGPDRRRLEARASELGVSDSVIFTGRISEEEKADIIRLADLFVMPSRGEGFGFVILEALACGVPVVASAADGTREAVLNGKLGLLVDPDDPHSILRGIRDGLRRPRGVPTGLDHFSYQNFSARLQHALLPALAR